MREFSFGMPLKEGFSPRVCRFSPYYSVTSNRVDALLAGLLTYVYSKGLSSPISGGTMSTKHKEHKEDGSSFVSTAETVPQAPIAEETAAPAGAAPVPDGADAEVGALRDRVAALEAREAALTEECSSVKDQYLRKLADDENFRKRMRREVEESRKFANHAILGDLVAILDDFDRAIASSEHSRDYTVLHDGISLIRRQFGQMLANKYGLAAYSAAGEPFDPNIHEAVASEFAEVAEPTVSQEFLPGYRLYERVIRSAKVKVQMPSPSASPMAEQSPSGSALEGDPSAEQGAAEAAAEEAVQSDKQ
jgi:molecular chaperone GrpE